MNRPFSRESPMSRRWLVLAVALLAAAPAAAETPGGYAVVVSGETLNKPDWQKVVRALTAKHGGYVLTYQKLDEVKALLTFDGKMPRYVCFVATPAEATREFVAQVHRITRKLDDDPYTDVIWGILTGYDAANALKIAEQKEPLVIKRAVAGTEIALSACPSGVYFSELEAGKIVRKDNGQSPTTEKGQTDSTKSIADAIAEGHTDLFVTSGHATEHDWQIGFSYRNGQFRSKAGQMFGVDSKGQRFPVNSPNPKAYLAVGNCLMGHIDGPDSMALAHMNSLGICQMIGYTELTWFGYGGWGVLDYFVEQPGRFTLAEAFYANQQSLLHILETKHPDLARQEEGRTSRNGYLYDRDAVAFYGDPAWSVKMAPGPLSWDQDLTEKDGVFTLTVTPKKGADSFKPVNTNGSQRGGRPIFAFLPHRVKNVSVIEGSELKPVVTDNFVMVPLPTGGEKPFKVAFKAEAMK
jgi:zinc protease